MEKSALFTHNRDVIHFNHASSSPLALPTRERMKKLVDELEFGDCSWEFWSDTLAQFRKQAATLLNAETSEIAFVPNTSTGLLTALYSIPWQKGDNLILIKDGFPANRLPWLNNIEAVDAKLLPLQDEAPIEERIMKAVDSSTKAVVLDWVDFFTGYKIDLSLIGNFCKEKNIFLVVDGMQGLGAVQLDLKKIHVDFITAGSAKWLLGPVGAGILYVNKITEKKLKPAFQGWMSLDWHDFNIFDPLPPLKQGAARFEPGSYPEVPLVGFLENLKIINKEGIQNINDKIFSLRKILVDGLKVMGADIISPLELKHSSGILTFKFANRDSTQLWQKIDANNIKLAVRKNAIRCSPHFYNTSDEVKKMLSVVEEFCKS